jgi:hypothetical protein
MFPEYEAFGNGFSVMSETVECVECVEWVEWVECVECVECVEWVECVERVDPDSQLCSTTPTIRFVYSGLHTVGQFS